jgi:hypothetical protein
MVRVKLYLPVLIVAGACASTELQTADTWAQRVCRLILAFPAASESALPPNVIVNVQVTPTVAVAILSAAPDAGVDAPPTAAAASAIPLPMVLPDAAASE